MEDAFADRDEERLGRGRALIQAEAAAATPERRDPYGSLGSVSLAEGNDLSVTARQYLYMVFKRRWLILGVAFAFLVLGGVYTLI